MKRIQFEILFFLSMLFISGIYYYQEGHFQPSGGLIIASILLVIEIIIYAIESIHKKYKKRTNA
ncbi:hypothetical protein CWC11_10235 [Pseudoalteromonas sp. S3178]|nr:hypothetical protein CWC11_10235 [Pseudoalteromonas sp. S3178]